VKTITLTDLRSEPGEVIRAVHKHGESFLLTKSGAPVAKLVPVDAEETTIWPDGSITGRPPLTLRRSDLLRNGARL